MKLTWPRLILGLALMGAAIGIDLTSSHLDASPARASAATTIPTQVVPTLTATPDRSVCETAATPQPTPGPTEAAQPTSNSVFPVKYSIPTGKSELLETNFYSAELKQEMPILIYLPLGYFDSSQRYPTLYMLSGFAGDYHEWNNWGMCDALETLTRHGQIQPMIVVMPEGGRSYWFNHATGPGNDGKPWGDYVWRDVVGYVDANYRTLPQSSSRAIGGLSAGGQAAFMLALTHPDVFSIAGGHSPSTRHADGSLPNWGDQAYFQQYDPIWLFQHTTTWKQLTLWIDVASGDDQWGPADHDLHNLLLSLGVPHDFTDSWPGIHDDYYWGAHIPDYLVWYSSKLQAAY